MTRALLREQWESKIAGWAEGSMLRAVRKAPWAGSRQEPAQEGAQPQLCSAPLHQLYAGAHLRSRPTPTHCLSPTLTRLCRLEPQRCPAFPHSLLPRRPGRADLQRGPRHGRAPHRQRGLDRLAGPAHAPALAAMVRARPPGEAERGSWGKLGERGQVQAVWAQDSIPAGLLVLAGQGKRGGGLARPARPPPAVPAAPWQDLRSFVSELTHKLRMSFA